MPTIVLKQLSLTGESNVRTKQYDYYNNGEIPVDKNDQPQPICLNFYYIQRGSFLPHFYLNIYIESILSIYICQTTNNVM